ncbi:MAG: DHH family phosphoesterase [Candidatus Micrarchaeia archaeon]|jgi:RecJ-like exonuclease
MAQQSLFGASSDSTAQPAEGSHKLGAFLAKCLEVGNACKYFENPIIVHHYDADGISTGSVVALALKRLGKPFGIKVAKRIDEETIARIAEAGRPAIFCDLGSGALSKIMQKFEPSKFAVIDHHELDATVGDIERQKVYEANQLSFGFDGPTDASASTVAYLCFRGEPEETRKRLSELAIVGAIGDMQDASGVGLHSLNRIVLDDAMALGSVNRTKDLRVFGRVSRTLVNFLSYCTEPFLPGLTGNEKACAQFLQKHGIPLFEGEELEGGTSAEGAGGARAAGAAAGAKTAHAEREVAGEKKKWLHYYDLPLEKRVDLASAIVEYAYASGLEEHAIRAMIGEVYLFPNEKQNTEAYDAYEFSTTLNACGRHDLPENGVKLCLGEDENALAEARTVLELHRRMIRNGIFFARKRVNDFGSFYFLDGRGEISDTVIGTVAGEFLGSGLVKRDKPILAFSLDEKGDVKVSGRGTKELLEKGLDLNQLMRQATAGFGLGGGHKIAAGASILQKGRESEFLMRAKEILKKQIG